MPAVNAPHVGHKGRSGGFFYNVGERIFVGDARPRHQLQIVEPRHRIITIDRAGAVAARQLLAPAIAKNARAWAMLRNMMRMPRKSSQVLTIR